MFRHFRVVLIPLQSPHSFPNFALPCRSHHTQSIHPGFPPLQDGGYCSTFVMLPLESSLLYAIHSPDIALPLFLPSHLLPTIQYVHIVHKECHGLQSLIAPATTRGANLEVRSFSSTLGLTSDISKLSTFSLLTK